MALDAIVAAARAALPAADYVILLSDERGLPDAARTALGAATVASLWSTGEPTEAFGQFVLRLSSEPSQRAVGTTVVDHACVGAFLVAEGVRLLEHGDVEGEGYLGMLPAAVEKAFNIELELSTDDVLFFTERLLLEPIGFRVAINGHATPMTDDEVMQVQESRGVFAQYECVLGI